MSVDTTTLTEARLNEIRAELAPKPDPSCRVCGAPMTMSGGDSGGTTWSCEGGDWRTGTWTPFEDMPERTLGDAHYSQSRVRRPHAPQVAVELLAEVDRLTARVAELERARDVAGIVGWLRAKVGAAYGSGQVPGTAGWTYREIADAIERGDWREGVERG